MVVDPPPVLLQPAAELAVVGAVGRVCCLMVAATPPVLVLPAAGLLVVGSVGRVLRGMEVSPAPVRPAAVRRAMRTVSGVATGRRREWPPLSSCRPARFLPEVLATR